MSRAILVVDDDHAMVKTLCDILRRRGWDSQGAYSGEQAIELQQATSFPIVLMDITMPGMGGIAAFRAMKAAQPALRAILMTAHTAPEVMEDATRAGAWRVMPKPLEVAGLLDLLDQPES